MNFRVESNIGLGKPINFFILATSWFLSGFLFNTIAMNPGMYLTWVLLTTTLSILSLSAIGYFDHHVPKPEINGVMSLLLVLPLSAIVSKWALLVITQAPLIRYAETLKAAVLVAGFFELFQVLVFRLGKTAVNLELPMPLYGERAPGPEPKLWRSSLS